MRHLGFLTGMVVVATLAPAPSGRAWSAQAPAEQCSRAGVRRLVDEFVRSYNRGKLDRLDEIWAQEPGFLGYYAVPERTHDAGEDRSNLSSYFENRHEKHDRLILKEFSLQEKREQDGSFDFYFEVIRRSEQRVARGTYSGKGNAGREGSDGICTLRLWNMVPLRYQLCSRAAASRIVWDFIFAYNHGNVPLIDDLIIAPTPEFESYTDQRAFAGTVPFSVSGDARPMLRDFFDTRHRFHDKLTLRKVEVNKVMTMGWGFDFRFRRTADDILLPGGIEQVGDGAINTDCRIFLWNAQ